MGDNGSAVTPTEALEVIDQANKIDRSSEAYFGMVIT